jgi:putative isomerase
MVFLVTLLFTVLANAETAIPTAPTEQIEIWAQTQGAVIQELQENLRPADATNPFVHVVPSPKFEAVYLWDSAFISQIWKLYDPRISQEIIQSVLVNQEPDGRIPLEVSLLNRSPLIQPPLLSWAVVGMLPAPPTQDSQKFLRDVYPKLKRFHQWIRFHRVQANGLFFWVSGDESGMDNSPRFSNRDESQHWDLTHTTMIDLSSYMVLDAQALAKIAWTLNLQQEAIEFEQEAEDLGHLIEGLLWNSQGGYFDDVQLDGKFRGVQSIASYLPLVAGLGTPAQKQKMLSDLGDPEQFNTIIPFPTVARNSPFFEKDCWRGPVWVNMGYLMIQGLHRAGADEQAHAAAVALVNGVAFAHQNTGSFVEFYDPDRYDFKKLSRKRGTGLFGFFYGDWNLLGVFEHLFAKEFFLGQKPVDHFVGWTGLINNLIDEEKLVPLNK